MQIFVHFKIIYGFQSVFLKTKRNAYTTTFKNIILKINFRYFSHTELFKSIRYEWVTQENAHDRGIKNILQIIIYITIQGIQ